MNISKAILLTTAFLFFFSHQGQAQAQITFQLNLKPQLEDSVFIPGRDVVKLKGNTYPLTGSGITLVDASPKDSVYSVEVRFPGSANGNRISYNFVLETEPKTLKESMPRQLRLSRGKRELDALYFDSFAW